MRKKKKGLFSRALIIAAFLLPVVSLLFWKWATSPVDPRSIQNFRFNIEKGESIDSIGTNLKNKNLIRSKAAFKIAVVTSGLSRSIQAGEFELSQKLTTNQIVQSLTLGRADVKLTLIEGLRREEMADELEKQFADKGAFFDKEAFLAITEGKEGYLFPDTYIIPKTMSAEEVVSLLLAAFRKNVDADLEAAIQEQGLSLEEGLVIASIVEREARFDNDRPIIAGILIKRWQNNWPLQADATVQYALGYQKNEERWWKRELTTSDLEINSPYNTYANLGLPPAPICNPSLSSIKAVANQKPTQFWFYLSDSQGNIHYAQTIEEHNANIAEYLNK